MRSEAQTGAERSQHNISPTGRMYTNSRALCSSYPKVSNLYKNSNFKNASHYKSSCSRLRQKYSAYPVIPKYNNTLTSFEHKIWRKVSQFDVRALNNSITCSHPAPPIIIAREVMMKIVNNNYYKKAPISLSFHHLDIRSVTSNLQVILNSTLFKKI